MKYFVVSILSLWIFFSLSSCSKQEYFKSEKTIKKELQGTWILIPIPLYDSVKVNDTTIDAVVHNETWTFDDTKVKIINLGQTSESTYSVNTTISKAEFNLDELIPKFILPARIRNSGIWRIVSVDESILSITSDYDGTQLEFHK